MTTIYKVLDSAAWQTAQNSGFFSGSAVDVRDGFIHFSAKDQLAETLHKHFAGGSDLVLLYIRSERIADGLRWEPSRGGALFPHLYAPLPVAAVHRVEALRLDAHGSHILPSLED